MTSESEDMLRKARVQKTFSAETNLNYRKVNNNIESNNELKDNYLTEIPEELHDVKLNAYRSIKEIIYDR